MYVTLQKSENMSVRLSKVGFGHNTTSKQERERHSTPGQAATLQTSNQQYLNYNRRSMLPVFHLLQAFRITDE
jgi:hypothetical protein